MRPDDRKYLISHEWCKIEDGIATLGISDFAIEHLSDLVFLDLPAAGTTVTAGGRGMVAQVLADTRRVMDHVDAQAF